MTHDSEKSQDIPPETLCLIKKWEGLKSVPYICSGNKLTIGYGHLIKDNGHYGAFQGSHIHNIVRAFRRFSGSRHKISEALKLGFPDLITKEEADRLLIKDASYLYNAAIRLVNVKLYETQKTAICSFVFNLGVTNFRKSTLLRKLNEGDYHGAANEFDRWIYAGKTPLQGLANRRAEEKELFLKSVS